MKCATDTPDLPEDPLEVNCRDLLLTIQSTTPPVIGDKSVAGLIGSMKEELFGRVFRNILRCMKLVYASGPNAV